MKSSNYSKVENVISILVRLNKEVKPLISGIKDLKLIHKASKNEDDKESLDSAIDSIELVVENVMEAIDYLEAIEEED